MGFIYLLYNDAGYGYIGQTVNIKERLYKHKCKRNETCSKKLGDFKCEILEECDNDCLADYERYYYDMYNDMFPNMLVNYQKPLQTKKESCKNWYQNNPEKNKEKCKKYRLNKKIKSLVNVNGL